MALSNLAELYDEAGSTKLAVKYYNESIKVDTIMKNYNGLYYSAIHLAEIYASGNDEKSLEYMNKALEYAKLLKEPFYIAGASLEIGDFIICAEILNKLTGILSEHIRLQKIHLQAIICLK